MNDRKCLVSFPSLFWLFCGCFREGIAESSSKNLTRPAPLPLLSIAFFKITRQEPACFSVLEKINEAFYTARSSRDYCGGNIVVPPLIVTEAERRLRKRDSRHGGIGVWRSPTANQNKQDYCVVRTHKSFKQLCLSLNIAITVIVTVTNHCFWK